MAGPRGTIASMATITARYDRSAARYLRYWAPVLEPTALGLIERVATATAGAVDETPRRVLDVGTGTGVLARAAVDRWPEARVTGLDGSRAMLDVAAGEAERLLGAAARDRLEWRTGLAEGLPFPDRSYDLVVSSFVYQLVPDRAVALREARRVLRPGGRLAYATWLDVDDAFEPQAIFDDLVDDERLDEGLEAEDDRAGDIPSPSAAASQLRRAGFREIRVATATLEHAWTARSYLEFLERYEAVDLFGSLAPTERRAVRDRLATRFAALPVAAFRWRTPVVMAIARRPLV